MSRGNSEHSRRRFLAATAALGSATVIAGCSVEFGGESSNDDESGNESNSGTQESDGTATEVEDENEDREQISWGATREFTLEEGDGRGPKFDDLAKPVQFEASAGDEVTIRQTSDAFDPYLILEGPDGSIVAENDDSEGSENSRISTTLSEGGEYIIWAGAFSFDTTGPFTLSLERGS